MVFRLGPILKQIKITRKILCSVCQHLRVTLFLLFSLALRQSAMLYA